MLGTHLLGIYEKAFDSTDSWSTRLQKAKNIGFDYMELSIDEQDSRIERLYWSRQQRLELLQETYACEMPLKSMCLSVHRRFPFGSAHAASRQKAHELMERAVELACDLGIRVIQLAGYDVYYEDSTPESVELFMEGMEWAASLAQQHQVMLAMEIMDTPFMNSITKHLRYEDAIRSPWYKVYPDLGNLSAWPENDPAGELEKGISSIVGVHVKDTIAVTADHAGIFKGVPFGDGCVDFPARFQQLETLGYSGPYMIEMWHKPGTSDVEQVHKAKEYIERAFYSQTSAPNSEK